MWIRTSAGNQLFIQQNQVVAMKATFHLESEEQVGAHKHGKQKYVILFNFENYLFRP